MRLISPLIFLSSLALASSSNTNTSPNSSTAVPTPLPPSIPQHPEAQPEVHHLPPSPFPSQTLSPSSSSPTSTHLPHLDLRQAVAPAAGAIPTVALQQSPITTYLVHDSKGQLVPVPYTQTFVAVPDQWPSPTPGTIGLGTIAGQVGVVKTKTKRGLALPTAVVRHFKRVLGEQQEDLGVRVERQRGRDGTVRNVRVVKRAVENAAAVGARAEWARGAVGVGLGVLVAAL